MKGESGLTQVIQILVCSLPQPSWVLSTLRSVSDPISDYIILLGTVTRPISISEHPSSIWQGSQNVGIL